MFDLAQTDSGQLEGDWRRCAVRSAPRKSGTYEFPPEADALFSDRLDLSSQPRLLPSSEVTMNNPALSCSVQQCLGFDPAHAHALKIACFDGLIKLAKSGSQA